MTNSTTYRISPAAVSTSTVKKSAAGRPSQCAARKVFHGIFVRRSGAGSMPWSFRMALIVLPRDLVAEVLQPPADAGISPGWILVRHAHGERRDVRLRRRSTRAARLRTVVVLGDECAVPPQDRVGCHDAGHAREVTTAEDAAFHGEPASLVVGQAQS